MFRLHLLGGAWIERDGARLTGAVAQRHRIALLARLAADPGRTLSREVLASLLWPERGQKESRHLLNVAVHALRRELGEDALESLGRQLKLRVDRVSCDLVDFRAALEQHDPDTALRSWGGPFLDGFFLDGSPEFQQWADLERARLSRQRGEALTASARTAEERGDLRTARLRFRALLDHEPHSDDAALSLMRVLEATGNRAAALEVAGRHASLMAEDFGAEPSPRILELAERMRSSPEPGPPSTAPAAKAGPIAVEAEPPAANVDSPAVPAGTPVAGSAGAREGRSRPWSRAFWLAPVGLALMGAVTLLNHDPGPGNHVTPPFASVAVLPFQDFSEGGNQAYLANGIAEEVLNSLAGIRGLYVPARSSSFLFEGAAVDIGEAARQLGVANVLEGSIRRDGGRLRVTAQLIDARTGYHLWSQQFDRDITDLLTVQEEIARAIAAALRVEMERRGAPLTVHSGVAPEAYDSYLRGRFAWSRRTPDGMRTALEAFDRAITLDPDYAAAWAGSASTWMLMPDHGGLPTREGLLRARIAAQRAIALDPDYAPAHATLGHVIDDLDRDRAAAGAAFRQAIALDPDFASARQWYGLYLANGGHFDEALAQLREARRLDPMSSIISTAVGAVRYFARDWTGAVAEYEAVTRADPAFAVAWALLGRVHLMAGRPGEAVSALRTAVELSEADASYRAVLASALVADGQPDQARVMVDSLLSVPAGEYIPYVELAPALMALGEVDEAMALYERGWTGFDTATKHLYVEPLHDPARGHPRFDALVARLGLPEDAP